MYCIQYTTRNVLLVLLRYTTLPRVGNIRNDGLLLVALYTQTHLPRKPVKKGFPFLFFFALGSI
jgi:hypothetical protein